MNNLQNDLVWGDDGRPEDYLGRRFELPEWNMKPFGNHFATGVFAGRDI